MPRFGLVPCTVLLVALNLPKPAPALDSWGPWRPRIVSAADGKSYVVAKKADKRFQLWFDLSRRRAGAAPIKELRARRRGVRLKRDPQDELLASGRCLF